MSIDLILGKNRLWVGAPIRGRLKFTDELKPLKIGLEFRDSTTDQSVFQQLVSLDYDDHGAIFDIFDNTIAPGVFDISVSIPNADNYMIAEPFWILSEEEFKQLAREEASENFEAAPGLRNSEEFKKFVEEITRLALHGDGQSEVPNISLSIEAPKSFTRPISSAPVQWTMEALINEINYLTIGGTKRLLLKTTIAGDMFSLECRGVLKRPLPPQVALVYRGRTFSELQFLNANEDLKNFAQTIKVAPYDDRIELTLQHEISAFPVSGATLGEDLRPKPRSAWAHG